VAGRYGRQADKVFLSLKARLAQFARIVKRISEAAVLGYIPALPGWEK